MSIDLVIGVGVRFSAEEQWIRPITTQSSGNQFFIPSWALFLQKVSLVGDGRVSGRAHQSADKAFSPSHNASANPSRLRTDSPPPPPPPLPQREGEGEAAARASGALSQPQSRQMVPSGARRAEGAPDGQPASQPGG